MEEQRRETDNPFQPISLDERLSRPVSKPHTPRAPDDDAARTAVWPHAVLSARRHESSHAAPTGSEGGALAE